MLRVAVFSDTHGSTALAIEAARRWCPDFIIHLGDYERDAETIRAEFPGTPFYNVRGNCDIAGTAPLTDTVWLGPVKAFLAHGHTYNVKWSPLSFAYAAHEAGASLALCGHTHNPMNEDFGGVRIVNPGTAGSGRQLTWAAIEIHDNGGIAVDIRAL